MQQSGGNRDIFDSFFNKLHLFFGALGTTRPAFWGTLLGMGGLVGYFLYFLDYDGQLALKSKEPGSTTRRIYSSDIAFFLPPLLPPSAGRVLACMVMCLSEYLRVPK